MKSFDIEKEKDVDFLHRVIEGCVRENYTDARIIELLMRTYESSSLFSVISFTEQVVYG